MIARRDYFNSFFFWLDIISTISLIFDIGLITSQMGLGGGNPAGNTAALARAGRASRVGTKAGRVVRLVRLIRIVKLYKTAQVTQKKKNQEVDEYDTLEESKVSKRLSDLTTKRVIIIVLSLLLFIPLFDTGYYYNPPNSMDYMIKTIKLISEVW